MTREHDQAGGVPGAPPRSPGSKGPREHLRYPNFILLVIGGLLLIVGIAAAFIAPIEVYVFYAFSEGGRFYYEGFGFGSFMFGYITWQVIGYYLIAILCIPLGYGHLRARRWTRTLSLALLWSWLILGVPLLVIFAFLLLSVKNLPLVTALIVLILLGASYLLLPGLLIRFYQSNIVIQAFEASDPHMSWIESRPIPVLVLGILFVFYIVVLHIPLFFNGIVPTFGTWLNSMQGYILLDVLVLILIGLTWGILRQKVWAWWGSLVYFTLLTSSLIITLFNTSFLDTLTAMDLPPYEMEIFQGMPLQSTYFIPFLGIPLLITLTVLLFSKRHFY
ncbi:MAG: hypothetical protein PVF74_01665 [Anaerolineales bacterium]|jgi:MFS family permease